MREMMSRGTRTPSSRPLSVFRSWRMREGSRGLVIIGSPRAASLDTSMMASADRDPAVAATDRQSGV
jgi:hypothetical protein